MSINTTQAAETQQYLEANPELLEFLKEWDEYYRQRVTQISIFNYKKTSQWTLDQKSHFIKVFYHCRGHFHELLWFIASYAPDKAAKDIIIANIVDEIGENGFSHEKLFGMTAQAVGVDITKEYINHDTYLPFAKAFNQGHLQWLNDHNWDGKMSAFAALERLDNVDYVKGKELAESLGLKGKELTFFNVHIHVDHFGDVLKGALIDIWNRDPAIVKEAFYFIADHQMKMWNDLSNEVFNYSRKSVNRVETIT
ncbi:MAG: iron-containing redox enzyme family protein [Legionellales bacterium]|jgi:hypothetical protein